MAWDWVRSQSRRQSADVSGKTLTVLALALATKKDKAADGSSNATLIGE